MTSSENDEAANWEKSVLNSAIGFNQVTHSVLWKKIIQFSGFVFLPIHMPFPISIGVASLIIVVSSSIVDHKDLIFSSKVDHFQLMK